MQEKIPHILYLGETRFPYGLAAVQRQILIAKGLVAHGCMVTVLSYKGAHGPERQFPAAGEFEGIHYRYTSGSIHSPGGFFNRNWAKLKGKFRELAHLNMLKKSGDLDACIVTTMDFDKLLIYRLWLLWLKVPLVLDYVELSTAVASRTSLHMKINDYFFDRFAVRLADGVTAISEYLLDHTNRLSPGKPVLKLPILCDFERFNIPTEAHGETRLLYCGAASYLPLIQFVLAAFDKLEVENRKVYLDFISGGTEAELAEVRAIIAQSRNKAHVRLQSNIPYATIPQQFANASALLIPLRPGLQDAARFPHKLGEYLASGTAVITTNFGEVNNYEFIDGETALVAQGYDPVTFAEKMKLVMDFPERAKTIGKNGRQMGLRNFNYKDMGLKMKGFATSLNTTEHKQFFTKNVPC
ncbi:MAG: glycosyltransferase [Saprospiraceae bacterium]|nr:glycosyltransferase [Saprospiraceae bacterium]MCF8250834.1 glycosyltransferase [Saprospiraceae bacterium]MCF8281651.1 glycosyltransferase [Bacteroidales bacterium]MCF8312635.1 glycosyltransferase [Saprospiraceae bacterium]MCF8441025.1 glycosyltransferase [Saprospiraceae bacterium]